MKKTITFFFVTCMFLLCNVGAQAQTYGTITVNGDYDKFYPVTFWDGGWWNNVAVELQLGRSNVHLDGTWHGSLVSTVRFHTNSWGNGAGFIDVNQRSWSETIFIGGWIDASMDNGAARIILWLRGASTYYFQANVPVHPAAYDGVQNPLPLAMPDNSSLSNITYKTAPEPYAILNGASNEHNAYFRGTGLNYMAGSLGIGTFKTNGHKLAVDGSVAARKIKVDQATWADYVFAPEYKLRSISEVEAFIKAHNHLPDIPSESDIIKDGVDVGEMNKKLLQKVEELTLYLIAEHKKVAGLQAEVAELKSIINAVGGQR